MYAEYGSSCSAKQLIRRPAGMNLLNLIAPGTPGPVHMATQPLLLHGPALRCSGESSQVNGRTRFDLFRHKRQIRLYDFTSPVKNGAHDGCIDSDNINFSILSTFKQRFSTSTFLLLEQAIRMQTDGCKLWPLCGDLIVQG